MEEDEVANNLVIATGTQLEPGTVWDELRISGIAGQRLEYSRIRSIDGLERGPYVGIGTVAYRGRAYILGYDLWKIKWRPSGEAVKFGVQAEFDLAPSPEHEWEHFKGSQAVLIKPAFIKTTDKNQSQYVGVHALISSAEVTVEPEISYWDEEQQIESFNHTDVGIGVLSGSHYSKIGLDINRFLSVSYVMSYTTPVRGAELIESARYQGLVVNLGYSFNLGSRTKKPAPSAPPPVSTIPDQRMQPDTAVLPLRYDPLTGKPIPAKTPPALRFDPLTGKEIEAAVETPEQIPGEMLFDPVTGQVITEPKAVPQARKRALSLSDLRKLENGAVKITKLNHFSSTFFLLDVRDDGIVVRSGGVLDPSLKQIKVIPFDRLKHLRLEGRVQRPEKADEMTAQVMAEQIGTAVRNMFLDLFGPGSYGKYDLDLNNKSFEKNTAEKRKSAIIYVVDAYLELGHFPGGDR